MQPSFGVDTIATLGLSLRLARLRPQIHADKNNHVMWPFTGIFFFRWALLKEMTLEDDDDNIRNLAASGDARVSCTTNSYANQAVEFGQSEAADDGNVYRMRWITPTIFYAISPGGRVVRRFVVDPGDEGFAPVAMHIASNRIAVLSFHEQTKEKRMKIVDFGRP